MTAAIRLTVDGIATVVLRYDQITAQDVADVNAKLGRAAAFAAAVNDPSTHDLDTAAALLWIGWRRDEPRLTFEQVAATLTYQSVVEIALIPELEAVEVAAAEGG